MRRPDGELLYPQVRHRNWTKTRTGNFGYLKGRACSIHQASKDCLIAPPSDLDLPHLNAPGKKLSNAPWERHWAVVNLLPKSVQMRAKDRVAIPANLYRIKQIDCPCESAKYRLRDRRKRRAVTLGALFLDLHRRDRNLSNHPKTFLSLCPLQFPK